VIYEAPPRVIYEAPPPVIIERPPHHHHKHHRPQVVYVPGEVVVIRPTAERVRLSRNPLPDRPYCREYRTEVRVGGRIEEGWGIACLQRDGAWRIER
jgi:surface antigen